MSSSIDAASFLEREIAECVKYGHERLDPVRTLASRAGVSIGTIRHALMALAQTGGVRIRHGAGVFLNSPEKRRTAPRILLKWEACAGKMLDAIIAGQWVSDGAAPSTKELCRLYQVNVRTLGKALHSLTGKGVLLKDGRRYLPHTGRWHGTILMVFDDGFFGESAQGYYYARAFAFVQALENGCARGNVTLQRVRCSDLITGRKNRARILGIIVWAPPGSESALGNAVTRFKPPDCPVVVVTMDDETPIPGLTSGKSDTVIIRPDDHDAGWRLGIHALERGYKRVAFFQSGNQVWSQRRMEGFLKAYHDAGYEECMTVFNQREMSDKDMPAIPLRWKKFARLADTLGDMCATEGIRTMLVAQLQDAALLSERSEKTRAQFEAALQDRSIQAWVTDSDTLAVYGALPVIKSTRAIPLLCFEDSIASFAHDLTTVDFNYAGAAHQALRLCLFPERSSAGKKTVRLIDIPVTIRCRGSG